MKIAKSYSDDEYYTTKEAAKKFVEIVILPSGILKHKTILMPFSSEGCPLHEAVKSIHKNVVCFDGNLEMWKHTDDYEDVGVIDNPPFSLSAKVEQAYFDKGVPFVMFRSAVTYPKFIFKQDAAGIIYENSKKGVRFSWGLGKHIQGDRYIQDNYPNLIDNLKSAGLLEKSIPIGFSYYLTDFEFKVSTVSFEKVIYPKKKSLFMYLNRGVFGKDTEMYLDEEDGRVKLISN